MAELVQRLGQVIHVNPLAAAEHIAPVG
jgi:hypothetical protein